MKIGAESHIVITGGGSGIGKALAQEARKKSANIWIIGRREDILHEACKELNIPKEHAISADLTRAEDRAKITRHLPEKIDILINNAGSVLTGAASSLQEEELQRLLEINLMAPMLLTQSLLPRLKQSKGRIVNVGSVFGDIAFPYFSAYSASKFALRGFSDALRRELKESGVTVIYAAPRATRTEAANQFSKLIEPMKMQVDAPETTAKYIWDGIERNKHQIYPKTAERFFVFLQKLLPSLIDRNLMQMAKDPAIHRAVSLD